ncbi:hypothetical protein [Staphylococcus warneri]|uniref:Uncharacterized protein n=1 Tax=Staphylococcus warneri TaxID=1292 RepID=A0A8B2ZD70_STAWA|nr:hypothetical protein [Staphylococcus warneri]RGM28287.1 hypothetical protein DXC19_11410 [Staphylococcus warneri]
MNTQEKLYLIRLSKSENATDTIIGRNYKGYNENMSDVQLYDALRGYWKISDTTFQETDRILGIVEIQSQPLQYQIVIDVIPNDLFTVTEEEATANQCVNIKAGSKYFTGNIVSQKDSDWLGKIIEKDVKARNTRWKIGNEALNTLVVE